MSMEQYLVEFDLDQNITILMPQRCCVAEALAFKQTFLKACQASPSAASIILDFSQTQFIDSSGIGALANSIKESRKKKISLLIKQASQQIMATLEMTGLLKYLHFEKQIKNLEKKAVHTDFPITHPSVASKFKRFIDIVGSVVGLGITALMLIPIAVMIKLDNPGPILFSQVRRGWMGKPFKLRKFRSMVTNAETLKHKVKNEANGAIFKNANDFRITKFGSFLRRSSLDEFPQFWNVLRGDMSLVGTRPPTFEEVDKYEIPQWQRLDVKPGITGEWQVNGRSRIKNFNDIIAMDLKYQRNWSHYYDLKLILKTVKVIFSKNSGAL